MKYRLSLVVLAAAIVRASVPAYAADDAPRPSKAFPILASTYAVMNALDIYTTTRVLQSGGMEANPIVGGAAGNPVALSALKAGTTASTIFLAHRLSKQHPKGAIVFLICANVGMGLLVSHNAMVMSAIQSR